MVKRPFLLITAILTAVLLGFMCYFVASSRTVQETLKTVVINDHTPEKAFPGQDQVNILLMGRDEDRDRHGNVVNSRGRTDAMMLVRVDFAGNTCSILSIPRDTLVRIPGYRGKRRISYANALGGPELAKETVSEFVGVSPDHHILVNYHGFEQAIDEMGGLEVNVDKQLDYDDNWGHLHIHLKPGNQVLSGEQAMGFVRYRKGNDGGGDSDLVRISRQQEVVKALTARLASPEVMFRVPKLLDMIREDVQGDLTTSQIICLARFAKALPPESGIRMETVPALEGGGIYVRADPDAMSELVDQMFPRGSH